VRNRIVRPGRRWAALAATLAAAGAAVVATGLGSSSQAAAPAADDGVATWTMMIYAVGDTPSVPQLMVENLAELTQLPSDPDVNVVVLLDLPELTDADAPVSSLPGVGDFSTAKLLVLDDGKFTEVRDLGEVSMGQPDTLASFVEEAADRFPAQHYGFTFFDHGGGNTGGYVDTGPPVGQDLSVPEMREGLIDGMQAAGIDRFDVINHAACLMANYETASALAPLTEWIAGSEEIMIYHPLAASTFQPLAQGGSGEDVANAFVQGYTDLLDAIAEDPGGQAYRELLAMSVVDGDAVAALDRAVESFSQAAVSHMPEITTEVAKARADALEYVAGFPGSEGESFDLIDLGDFLRHLTNVPDDVAVARDAVSAALDRAVTLQSTGKGTQQATGMNVYLPANPRNVNQQVLSDGTEPQGWGEFVQAFVESATGSSDGGDGVRFVSKQAQILQADTTGIKIAGTLAGGSSENLTSADTYVFTQLGGQQALALIFPAYVDAGGPGQVQGVWDYGLTALTNGKTSVPATTQYQAQSGGLLGTFLARYTAPSGDSTDIGVRVLLSGAGEIESVSTFDLTTGSSAGISLEVGGTLTPYVFVPSSNGYQQRPSDQSIQITEDLQVDFVRLPATTQFDMALVVGDAAGNVDVASASARVP
jgi:hypothetical protein